jgi:hypothetical protein
MKDDGLTKYERYRLKDLEAYRERKREYAKTPEQRKVRNDYMKIWREKNRDKHNQQAKESHHRNKHKHVGKMRKYHLKYNYNMTEDDYNKMLIKQNESCKICGTHESKVARKRLHVDHDHNTGEIRGLLCSRCNGALGWYEKHRENIENYIETTKNQ